MKEEDSELKGNGRGDKLDLVPALSADKVMQSALVCVPSVQCCRPAPRLLQVAVDGAFSCAVNCHLLFHSFYC